MRIAISPLWMVHRDDSTVERPTDRTELCPECEHPYLIPIGDEIEPCEYCCNEVRAGKRPLENVCQHYAADMR